MKKMILIDGNAILHKAFHALPPFHNSKGVMVNAVYGFASMLLNLLNLQKPDYIACTFDMKAKTFRHVEYADYKATRTKAPQELYDQLPLIKEMVAAFNIPIYEKEGFEADDLLGCLAARCEKLPDVEAFIVTGDLDTLQLVSERVKIFAMHRGFSKPIIFDRQGVYDKCGLYPEQIADMKGLQGDSSDNIKGVLVIGQKTTLELLQKYGTLEGVYEHLEDIKGATRKKLEAGRESAFLSKRLATIVCEIEGLEVDLEACTVHDYSPEELGRIFDELEFKSLAERVRKFNFTSDAKKKEIAQEKVQESLF